MTGSTYAVLVAVEHYQQSNIRGVPFAVADAPDLFGGLAVLFARPVAWSGLMHPCRVADL